ncbi:aldo/keto reductase [Virgibacillus xinjiangensis]|uniref:Aldo/keto reductase n=1 Tax=Virgibacillus xinjiangensis TaxID=393090 RepID=A0ABV7CW15_9BACI
MKERVQIGNTDLYVNPVGLGTNTVGGHNIFPDVEEETGREVVRTALENGINFLDTAYMYGMGRSEELIGEVVKERGSRQELVIASKVSPKIEGKDIVHDNHPAFLKDEAEKSLKRLGTDYIDLLYIHYPDQKTPEAEAVGALKELKDEGKIRAIGISNFSPEQMKAADQDGYVDVYQGEYNLLNRNAEAEIFPYAAERNISYVPFFPLASGLLTGKYTKDTVISGFRESLPYFQEEAFEQNVEKVENLRSIAEAKGVDITNLVLAWYLTRDTIDTIIPGAKRTDQVLSNLKTLDVQLTQEESREVERIFQSSK